MYIIGQVKEYDGKLGIIVSTDINYGGKYIFLKKDLEDEDVAVGDMVEFRAELIHNTPRAFFVIKKQNVNKNINIYRK